MRLLVGSILPGYSLDMLISEEYASPGFSMQGTTDITQGAIITFFACWVVQPWQLINKAATFITVLSSFSVFLAPIVGVMTADFFLIRKRKIQLSHLYRVTDTNYWYWRGFNWRVIVPWLAGWTPTVGGLILTVRGETGANRGLFELFYMAFFFGKLLLPLLESTTPVN